LKRFLLLVILIPILFAGCTGTTTTPVTDTEVSGLVISSATTPVTPVTTYVYYEMKSDDIRLEFCNHPLYSFEYPSVFNCIDLNNQPPNTGRMPMTYDESRLDFTVEQLGLPKPELSIIVQQPGYWEYHNASEKFNFFMSNSKSACSVVTNNTTVSGIPAYYIEEFYDAAKSSYYPAYKGSSRTCIFDYAGLIWDITMNWNYNGTEPREIQEYFDHVVETFKIIEICDVYARSSNILDLSVEYSYNTSIFTITNNEKVPLNNIEIFFTYVSDNSSKKFTYYPPEWLSSHRYLESHKSLEIVVSAFKDSNNNLLSYISRDQAFTITIQAERPGCKRLFSYSKTWE
jgi:hypothetical protein